MAAFRRDQRRALPRRLRRHGRARAWLARAAAPATALAFASCGSSGRSSETQSSTAGGTQSTAAGSTGTATSGAGNTETGAATTTTTGSGSARPWAQLQIRYDPHRLSTVGAEVWTLTCGPAGGDHPQATATCAELAAHRTLLLGGDRSQPQCGVIIANGPSVLVTGTLDGREVHYSPVSICNPGWSKLRLLLTGA